MINKDQLKESLDINEVSILLEEFGGEPSISSFGIISRTICHNHPSDKSSRKLFYYENTHLFKCFTECSESFDIFELVIKCFKIQRDSEIGLSEAIKFILSKLGKSFQDFFKEARVEKDYFLEFLENETQHEKKEFKEYEENLIENLPCLRIEDWEEDGIFYKDLQKYNIRYYIPTAQVVIPHYNINSKLIGIRGRQMIQEEADKYGKYMPLIVSGEMYNHPLGFNLYGIHLNKQNIINSKTVILVEGEKSVLQAENFLANNIVVAVCGSSISKYQIDELISLGVTELIIAFDRQYKEYGDEECLIWHDKINKMVCKYKIYFNITIMFDTENLLEYKDSPTDKGKEVFETLLKERKVVR